MKTPLQKDITRVLRQKKESQENKKRSKRRKKEPFTKERKALMIYEYVQGSSYKELEDKYHISQRQLKEIIDYHMNDISVRKEEALLVESSKHPNNRSISTALQKLKDTELMTDSFLSLLSSDTSPILTDEESLFANVYVTTGDSREALELSGLDVGIQKDKKVAARRAVLIRSSYLRSKNNIRSYINDLRDDLFNEKDVTKKTIQQLILEEIYKMKEKGDPRDKVNLRQSIEMLGKTIGAFTERVEIQEVDPSKSLDLLIEMAKEAEVKELE